MPILRSLGFTAPFLAFSILALASCSVPDDTSGFVKEDATTKAARKEMVGLSEADLRMCAGFPSATANDGKDGQIWTYEHTSQRGNLNVAVPTMSIGALPIAGGSVNVAPGGYCNTQVRLQGGHVVEVAYAGDNNTPGHLDSLCVSSVDACVEYARRHKTRSVNTAAPVSTPTPEAGGDS